MPSDDLVERAGDWSWRAMKFVGGSLGTFLALVFVWALTESFTPFKVPMSMRMILAAAVGLTSLGAGVLLARSGGKPSTPPTQTGVRPPAGNSAMRPASAAPQPAAAPSAPEPAIERARYRPIVFRELYPPPADAGLSFYGGVPVVPADFAWPRAQTKQGETPLHFVMQWDCVELAAHDAAGLLPRDGALYLFCDLAWGDPMSFRFIHVPAPTDRWVPLAPPPDLGPVFGDEGAHLTSYVAKPSADAIEPGPQLLPRWPFQPVAIDYPREQGDDSEAVFWEESTGVGEALLAAQNDLGAPLTTFSTQRDNTFARPFPSFPHDWAAVRVVCVQAMRLLSRPVAIRKPTFLREIDEAERAAKIDQWLAEAQELYARASIHPLSAALAQQTSDEIWSWIEEVQGTFAPSFRRLAEESVNVSFGLGSEGVSSIPPEWIADNSLQHALAHEYIRDEYQQEFAKRNADLSRDEAAALWKSNAEQGELTKVRQLFAPVPNHMFGPPSYVQGYVEERVDGWLVLLELVSRPSIGMNLGEGVMQFLIRPDDLRAGRFDKAELVISAY